MPLFRLSNQIDFPPAWLARSDGLLCIGGDLKPQRLILAYQNGIFPWFSENEPILWWSPDPRLVLFPRDIKISRSLKKSIRKHQFSITFDQAFEETIRACAAPRGGEEDGTWLMEEMIEAYVTLHHMGIAHSVETWSQGKLVGGLYGLSLGKSFFGESMFHTQTDASKAALAFLANHLACHNFDLIDCQITSDHLLSLGAREIPRQTFLKILKRSVHANVDPTPWNIHSTLKCPKGDPNEIYSSHSP